MVRKRVRVTALIAAMAMLYSVLLGVEVLSLIPVFRKHRLQRCR